MKSRLFLVREKEIPDIDEFICEHMHRSEVILPELISAHDTKISISLCQESPVISNKNFATLKLKLVDYFLHYYIDSPRN